MLCDECKNNPATIHFMTIVNGAKEEKRLCAECAKKLGANSFMPFSLGDVLPSTLSSVRHSGRVCPTCGTTLHDISRSGLLGCPDCYEQLKDSVLPMVQRVQNHTRHTGRSPVGFESKKLNVPQSSPVDELKKELAAAVAKEEYEKAAELRDKIKELQAKEADHGQI